MADSNLDRDMPRDVWIDIETGEWGLVSNLRLIHQTDLPFRPMEAHKSIMRCAGIDYGIPVTKQV